jgi:hypothetical protein
MPQDVTVNITVVPSRGLAFHPDPPVLVKGDLIHWICATAGHKGEFKDSPPPTNVGIWSGGMNQASAKLVVTATPSSLRRFQYTVTVDTLEGVSHIDVQQP